MTFEQWKTKVENIVEGAIGVQLDDLPDMPYRINFDAGMSASEMAEEVFDMVNDEFEEFVEDED